jgi:multiple sugar transport system permease protein
MKVKVFHVLQQIQKKKICYLFIAPFFILFFIFTVLPVLSAMGLSLTYYNVLELPRFIGLENYIQMFFYDDLFIKALLNTLTMAMVIGPIGFLASFILSWMLAELNRGIRTTLVVMLYAPSISGNLFLVWSLIFHGDAYGYLNSTLMNMGLIEQPIQWTTDTRYMMAVVILVSLWMSLGTSFLSFIAGLQGVDLNQIEAGLIDGVRNRWQELWYIILPSMKPQLLFGSVMSITAAFSVGAVGAALCGEPSVDYAVHTIINHLNDHGITRYEMGYACAISTVLFFMMVISNKLIHKILRKVGT